MNAQAKKRKTRPMTRREKRLLAAAPCLLAAMKQAVKLANRNLPHFGGERSKDCQESYEACVAAIAKAEGR